MIAKEKIKDSTYVHIYWINIVLYKGRFFPLLSSLFSEYASIYRKVFCNHKKESYMNKSTIKKETDIDTDKCTPETLADFLISRFKKNIEAFRKYYPEISDKFENYVPQKSMDFFCSQSGTPNMAFAGDDNSYYEKNCYIQYKKFKMEQLEKIIKNNFSDQNDSSDYTDPKQFSKFQVKDILNGKINIFNNSYEGDLYGQLHHKYFSLMSKIYEKNYKGDVCQLADSKLVPLFFLIGVGLGYQLWELYLKIEITHLVIIEPDNDVFFAALHTFDWEKLLEKITSKGNRLTIILESNADIIGKKFLECFILQGFYTLGAYFVYLTRESESNHAIIDELKKSFRLLPSSYGFLDDRLFGASHCVNHFLQKKHFVNTEEMSSIFRDFPVFIIGSGPSLDNDIPFLRKYQDKAIIIACGTSIDVLYHAGIHPDFYANTERVPETKQALSVIPDPLFFKDIILLCGHICHPSVVDMFDHTAIFSKEDENFCDYISVNLKLPRIQPIVRMNPLVGNMGLSGALTLGFRKIYLFGMDCGKSISFESNHSEYTTLYKQIGYSDDNSSYNSTFVVPANFSGECGCNDVFYKSILSMQLSLKDYQDKENILCFNCSDGARIEGAKPVHSIELENDFSQYPDIDKNAFISYIDKKRTIFFEVKADDIKKIIYPEIIEKICKSIQAKIQKKPKTIEECLQTCKEINDFLNEIGKDISLTYFQRTVESAVCGPLVIITSSLFENTNKKKCLKSANKILNILDDYLTEVQEVYKKLPDYVMGDHRKHYPNGKVGRDMPHCKAPNFPNTINIIKKKYDDPVKKFVKRYI